MLDPFNWINAPLWWSQAFFVGSTIKWYLVLFVALGMLSFIISMMTRLIEIILGIGLGMGRRRVVGEFMRTANDDNFEASYWDWNG